MAATATATTTAATSTTTPLSKSEAELACHGLHPSAQLIQPKTLFDQVLTFRKNFSGKARQFYH